MTPQEKEIAKLTVRVSPWMYNGLEVVSAKLGMTISDVIRMGVNNIIKKELTNREQGDLADNEATDFLINDYRKTLQTEIKGDKEFTDDQDEIHVLLQELRSLKAENFDGMGTAKSYERSWRVRQILAREYGKVIDLDKMDGRETHYGDFYCSRYHEKEMQYLNRLAKQYEKDRNRLKDKPIKISENEYLIFYGDDPNKQEKINNIISEIRQNLDEALVRFEYSHKNEKATVKMHLEKVYKLKKKLAIEYGVFYEVEKDPKVGFYNSDFSKDELEKENKELNKLIEEYNKKKLKKGSKEYDEIGELTGNGL